jgi:RNA polymerase sigma factor (sigma-70 family)
VSLLGPYQLEAVYSQHERFVVHRAAHSAGTTHLIYVLKVPTSTHEDKAVMLAAEPITHASVLPFADLVSVDGHVGLVTMPIHGRPLATHLPMGHGLSLADELAPALFTAFHAASVANTRHLCFSPQAVWLHRTQGRIDVRVCGFGAAELGGATGDARTDIFDLGCVLYETLTGLHPFPDGTDKGYKHIADANPALPARIDRAIRGALQPQARGRFATFEQFQEAWTEDRGPSNPWGNIASRVARMATTSTDRRFHSTQWSVVLGAGDGANLALSTLCSTYWYPLYAFMRRRGADPEEAADLTQGFFASLLERNDFAAVDRKRGKFRSYLLSAMSNYMAKHYQRKKALKRGGGQKILSLDWQDAEGRYAFEPVDTLDAERLYDRRWTLTLLAKVVDSLRDEHTARGKIDLFQDLVGSIDGNGVERSYRDIATDHGMSEGAVKVAVHRLKKRWQQRLREEVAETVDTDEEIDEEIRFLLASLE